MKSAGWEIFIVDLLAEPDVFGFVVCGLLLLLSHC